MVMGMIMKYRKIFKTIPVILVLCLIGSVYAEAGNLVKNPSVEWGTPDNWTNQGAGAKWANIGHTGIHSLLLDTSSAEASWLSNVFNVTGNGNFTFGFWVNGSASTTFYVYLRFWSDYAGAQFISQIPFPIGGSYTDWQQVNVSMWAPDNTLSADVFCTTSGGTGTVYLDDFFYVPIIESDPVYIQWLREIFYGTGFWFTLIIMMAIIVIVSAWNAYGGILFLPITIFLGLDYFRNIPTSSDFMWGAITMMFGSIYIFIMLLIKARKK